MNDHLINESSRITCRTKVKQSLQFLFRKAIHAFYGKTEANENKRNKTAKIRFMTIEENSPECTDTFPEKLICKELLTEEENQPLVDLPFQIRVKIYSLLTTKDVLFLRLTCRAIKEDVEACRGVCFKLHDGRFGYEESLQGLGIETLIVEHFIQEDIISQQAIFPYPEILKTIEIIGPISKMNFEFLLKNFSSLKCLVLRFEMNEQVVESVFLRSLVLHNLQELSIISNIFGTRESPSLANTIRNILCDIRCPNLSLFRFYIMGFVLDRIHEYHLRVQMFITKHPTLQRVDVQLSQLTIHEPSTVLNLEGLQVGRIDGAIDRTQLSSLELTINARYAQLWYPIIDTQSCLKSLVLEIPNQSWSRLVLVLNKNANTLRSLVITGICLTMNDGMQTVPLDLGLLRNLKLLENLEIHHLEMEPRGLASPEIFRTSHLPQNLKSIRLCNMLLKPHQCMFLLVKLNQLESLNLEFWADTEGALGAFLTVLTFLLKFELTTVTTVWLRDSRRRMENRENDIDKMKLALQNKSDIIYEKSEMYSELKINLNMFVS